MTDLEPGALANLIGRVRARYCEPGTDVDAHQLAVAAEQLLRAREAARLRADAFQRVVEAAMEWRSHSASAALPDPDDQALIRAVDTFRGTASDGSPLDRAADLASYAEWVLGVTLTPWQRTLLVRLERSAASRRRPTVDAHNSAEVDGG